MVHVIRLPSFRWLWFQSVCPLMCYLASTVLLGFLLPWRRGLSSLLQQSGAADPYLGCVVSPHSCCSWPWTWSTSSHPWLDCAATVPAPGNESKPCRVGSPKTARSWWRGLTEWGPLEKGMANHFIILALRTPWTIWEGKMIEHWKMNLPGQ